MYIVVLRFQPATVEIPSSGVTHNYINLSRRLVVGERQISDSIKALRAGP